MNFYLGGMAMRITRLVLLRLTLALTGVSALIFWTANGGKFVSPEEASMLKLIASLAIGLLAGVVMEGYISFWHEDMAIKFLAEYREAEANGRDSSEAALGFNHHNRHLSHQGQLRVLGHQFS